STPAPVYLSMLPPPPRSPLFPYTPLFRSVAGSARHLPRDVDARDGGAHDAVLAGPLGGCRCAHGTFEAPPADQLGVRHAPSRVASERDDAIVDGELLGRHTEPRSCETE